MWHLEYPEKKTLKWYENRFLKKVYESINNSTLEKGIKDIILKDGENSLKTLLLSPPEQLYSFNEKLEKELSNKGLWTKKNRALLLSAFGYDKFIAKKKDVAYELSENILSKTCVYCNRIYTFTVDGEKDNNKIVRPDFDHWMLKTEHPLLSMSFFNLIPSCPICNRSIKLEKDFEYGKHIHPYMSKSDASFSFQFVPLPNFEWDVRIVGGSQEELNTAKLLETEQFNLLSTVLMTLRKKVLFMMMLYHLMWNLVVQQMMNMEDGLILKNLQKKISKSLKRNVRLCRCNLYSFKGF